GLRSSESPTVPTASPVRDRPHAKRSPVGREVKPVAWRAVLSSSLTIRTALGGFNAKRVQKAKLRANSAPIRYLMGVDSARQIRNLTLVGFMGTGKSTVGRLAADILHFTFL